MRSTAALVNARADLEPLTEETTVTVHVPRGDTPVLCANLANVGPGLTIQATVDTPAIAGS